MPSCLAAQSLEFLMTRCCRDRAITCVPAMTLSGYQSLAASSTLVVQLMPIAPHTEVARGWWDCGSLLPQDPIFLVLKWSYRYK